jgi:hypothetical protein
VTRNEPVLNAWLTNNYWDVNFSAAQSGALRFRFHLNPHAAEPIEQSVREALCQAVEPAVHVYKTRGAARHDGARLLDVELGTVILTQLETVDAGLTMTLLNPSDSPQQMQIGQGVFRFDSAAQEDLSGTAQRDLPLSGGRVSVEIAPRAWLKLHLRK